MSSLEYSGDPQRATWPHFKKKPLAEKNSPQKTSSGRTISGTLLSVPVSLGILPSAFTLHCAVFKALRTHHLTEAETEWKTHRNCPQVTRIWVLADLAYNPQAVSTYGGFHSGSIILEFSLFMSFRHFHEVGHEKNLHRNGSNKVAHGKLPA